MVELDLTTSPSAAATINGVLLCLGRFNETVFLEAREDTLTLSTLNASRTGHALFAFGESFFENYRFVPDDAKAVGQEGRFTCALSNKALAAVFKARLNDSKTSNGLEACEITLRDRPNEVECRLVVRMICAFGVIKTNSLMYESVEIMTALFDKHAAINKWSTKSSYLKEAVEYFSPKTEQLDIYHEDGKVTFMSFTEKVTGSKNEVLRQPLKTAVTMNASDFTVLDVQERLHIVISVKDFRAMVSHADFFDTTVNAFYSEPGKPLQFTYNSNSLFCSFTIMTSGENRAIRNAPRGVAIAPVMQPSRAASTARDSPHQSVPPPSTKMPPPPRPEARSRTLTGLGRRESDTPVASQSFSDVASREAIREVNRSSSNLFVQDDDTAWDPDYQEDDEEMVQWDATGGQAALSASMAVETRKLAEDQIENGVGESLPPTQTMSQIPRLW